ncbi:MAG: hypothetical protein AB7D28_03835 [Candidatus Berkiella sp.]
MSNKSVSEIRQYLQFKKKVHLGIFLVIPITISLYMSIVSEPHVISAILPIFAACFFSIAIGNSVMFFRYTEKQRLKFSRFEEKNIKKSLKILAIQLISLVMVAISCQLIVSSFGIKEMDALFLAIILIGFMQIMFKPRARTEKIYGADRFDEEYQFSSHASPQYDNFLMNPSHPSSLINPTNPASSTHISRDI